MLVVAAHYWALPVQQLKSDDGRGQRVACRKTRRSPHAAAELTCGNKDRLFVLSAYLFTAISSSIVMWSSCCSCSFASAPDLVEPDEEHVDWLEKMPGPSSDTDSRAQDSSNECSGMMPNEIALLPTATPPAARAGVD